MKTHSKAIELTLEEAEKVTGGTDYTNAQHVLYDIATTFNSLIVSGVSPEEARAQVKSEYWDKVLEICAQHPDECGIEKQAQVVFMFVIGS